MSEQIPMMDASLSVTSLTGQQVRDASLILAGYASGPDELAEWLEACGLRPYLPGDRMWTGRPRQVRPSRRRQS